MAAPVVHTYLFILICMHARSRLERGRVSATIPMSYEADETNSVHATSRSLFPLLSVPSFEGLHLSILLNQHRLRRRWARVPHSNLRRHTLGSRRLKRWVTWVRGVLLIRNPLHRARPWTLVWWKLLRAGSTWSPRHPASHPTSHSASHSASHSTGHAPRHSAWDVALHTGRYSSRYTARDISDRRAARCILHNLLSGFLSSDIHRRKVGRLEGV